MAAAAFKATVKVRGQDGWTWAYPCTVSDVDAAFYVFPDGNNDVVLPTTHGTIMLTDLILSAAGTDTTTADIFVAGVNTGVRIQNAANLASNVSRQFFGSPVAFAPGARVRIKQNT